MKVKIINTVFLRVSEGAKPDCNKSFKPFIYCRSKFISRSEVIQKIISTIGKILKQVRNDTIQLLNFSIIKRTFAFTLAETLIVMGIIGVVAALTLPNLNSSTGNKEKVAKVKKIYSNIEDALGRAQAVYGPLDEWCQNINNPVDCNKKVGERITEFMKISKNCGLETYKGCFANKQYYMNKSDYDDGEDTFGYNYKVILADGTSLTTYTGNGINYYLYVDIDGPNKGDNTYNKDIFSFDIIHNTLSPSGTDVYSGDYSTFHCNSTTICTAWVIQNGNMDYLKVGSDNKCPDGTKLNWTTKTTCK